MASLPLSRGLAATVDDVLVQHLVQWSWFAQSGTHTYAARWDRSRGDPKIVLLHRYLLKAGADELVDHIDGNPLNNRLSNLRICTPSQNSMNAQPIKKTSKYKGVFFDRTRGKWRSMIQKEKKKYFVGRYSSEVDAAIAYDAAAREMFGEFAYLNFPDFAGSSTRLRGAR